MSAFWAVDCSTIYTEDDSSCEKRALYLSYLSAIVRLFFMPVEVLPICTRFLVDLLFLRGLILLRDDDGTPFMGN